MQRRDFIKRLGGLLGLGAMAGGVAACDQGSTGNAPATSNSSQRFKWKMVTTWPRNFPGLGTGAQRLADTITRMSGGQLTVKLYSAGEIVPALEAFDAVANGSAEMAHGAAYYWKGKAPSAQFFAAVPFGMNAQEMHAWLYHGGGQELWKKAYAPFGILPFAAGNSGVQMGGWFNKEIHSPADLEGLKMRIPGLGGEILERAGGLPVTLPGGEIFTSLKTGVIDATEWVGPWNDLAFGLHEAAKYYYYPGWHEPGSVLECLVNEEAFAALPEHLQAVVELACQAVTTDMLAEYTAQNPAALKALVEEHGVILKPFPDSVMRRLRELSEELVAEMAAEDPLVAEVAESFRNFKAPVMAWHEISEEAFYKARKA
ncbi:MAG: TRAP transporter substrate-binding protein [Gammaproteobacteria bacterium]|nr:TRAP transporter substrate-binding protein [Gammaproteobacteria bacterium]